MFPSYSYAATDVYYFTENDGKNRTIFYKAMCATINNQSRCELKYLSLGNKKSLRSCGIEVETLYTWGKAIKQGEEYVVSKSAGLCDYTNTYIISKTGLTQVKTSPKKKKSNLCTTFRAKTHSMDYHKDVSQISLNSKGCDNINILSFN